MNSILSRAKGFAGRGLPIGTKDVVAAFALQISEATTEMELTAAGGDCTSTDIFLVCPSRVPGRRLTLVNADASAVITLGANTLAAASEGMMIAGGDQVLNPGEAITLMQRTNGSWQKA